MAPPHISEPNIDPSATIMPGTWTSGQVKIGPRVFLLPGVVIRAEYDRIEVGAETNIQDNSVVHCDDGVPCLIGERVTIGHAAVVHGAQIGDHSLVGIGSRLLNNSRLGEGAWLAAGSILTDGKEIPPWTLAMGVPAKPVRNLTDEEIAKAAGGVDHYLDLASAYRQIT